jgi:hypothetical protein
MTFDPRRRLTLLFVVGAVLSSVPARGGDQEFKIVAHPGRPGQVERTFLADAFLKNVTRWSDDETIRPVDQRPDSLARKRFSETVLRRSVPAVKTYWQQRIFSGRGVPPPELDSDEAVVRYVESHEGAVGYVSGATPVGKAKVVAVLH